MSKDKKVEDALISLVLKSLEDRKANDIVCIDLRENEDAIVNYFVICHGDSITQVNALAGNLERDISNTLKMRPYKIEGQNTAQWVVVDYVDVVVHIFYRDVREFYQLEELWSDGVSSKIEVLG